jgi:hypothetical protein
MFNISPLLESITTATPYLSVFFLVIAVFNFLYFKKIYGIETYNTIKMISLLFFITHIWYITSYILEIICTGSGSEFVPTCYPSSVSGFLQLVYIANLMLVFLGLPIIALTFYPGVIILLLVKILLQHFSGARA